MKPYLAIPLFLLGAVAIDRAVGLALGPLSERVMTARDNSSHIGLAHFAVASRNTDVIVFGSSRAKYHFDPAVMEAELGLSVVNVAANARGIGFARMLESEMLRRGTRARLFILQVDLADFYDIALQRSVGLAPWYGQGNPVVDDLLERSSRYAWFKLQSHAYRYNGKLLRFIRDLRHPTLPGKGGFVPLHGVMTQVEDPEGREALLDTAKKPLPESAGELHREFIRAAREHGISVLVVVGPRLRKTPISPESRYTVALAYLERLVAREGAWFSPLTDLEHPELREVALYRDPLHVNETGAAILSRILAKEVRRQWSGAGHPVHQSQTPEPGN